MPILETWQDVAKEINRSLDPDWKKRMDDIMFAANFSGREKDVAILLVKAYSAAAIAYELDISEHTVRQYKRQIYQKLEVEELVSCVLALVGVRPR